MSLYISTVCLFFSRVVHYSCCFNLFFLFLFTCACSMDFEIHFKIELPVGNAVITGLVAAYNCTIRSFQVAVPLSSSPFGVLLLSVRRASCFFLLLLSLVLLVVVVGSPSVDYDDNSCRPYKIYVYREREKGNENKEKKRAASAGAHRVFIAMIILFWSLLVFFYVRLCLPDAV